MESSSPPIGGRPFAVSADWSRLAWAATSGGRTAVYVGDISNPDQSRQVADIPLFLSTVMATLAFTPDGRELVVGGFASPTDQSANAIAVIDLE